MSDRIPVRISISEAARLFGVSTITLRRAIQQQKISYVVVQGRYKLNFDSVLRWSQSSTRTQMKLLKQGIGQYVDRWRISNPLYSPNPRRIERKEINTYPHEEFTDP